MRGICICRVTGSPLGFEGCGAGSAAARPCIARLGAGAVLGLDAAAAGTGADAGMV